MRVTEAFQIIDRNLPLLEMPEHKAERLHDNTQGFRYTGMTALIEAVAELSKVPGLEPECAALQRTTFFRSGNDSGLASHEDWNSLHAVMKELTNVAKRLRTVFRSMMDDESPNTIAVKLPPVESLEDFKRTIGELQLALERPVQLVLQEHLHVEGVDRGSIWLLFACATGVAKFTFGLLFAANHYMRKRADLDRYLEGTKAITGLNNYVATIENANATMMEALGKSLADQLLEGREVDGEAVNTTLNAIKTLAELRKQGLEMQLAANAPKEVRDVFEQYVLKDMGVGELLTKVPAQLTAGAAKLPAAPEAPSGDPEPES